MKKIFQNSILLSAVFLAAVACQQKELNRETQQKELNRETAMKLLQARTPETVRANFIDRLPDRVNDPRAAAYHALESAAVIRCLLRPPDFFSRVNPGTFRPPGYPDFSQGYKGELRCQPIPNSGLGYQRDGISAGVGVFSLMAGEFVPSDVTGISKTGKNTALVEVRLSFRPSALYSQHRAAFDRITANGGPGGGSTPLGSVRDRMARATFRRYDDGWRLEGVR